MTRLLISLALLLGTLPVHAAPPEPQEVFDAMSSALLRAAKFHIEFNVDYNGPQDRTSHSGELFVDASNRLRMDRYVSQGRERVRTLVISNGKDYAWKTFHKFEDAAELRTPRWLKRWMMGLFVRLGAHYMTTSAQLRETDRSPMPTRMPDLDNQYPVKNFRDGGHELVNGQKMRVIEFDIERSRGFVMKMRLWVDPDTSLPVRRVTRFERLNRETVITETYTDIEIDPKKIPRSFDVSEAK